MKKFYAGIALAGMIAALALTGCPGPNNPVYSISLDTTGTHTFTGASAGYGAQTAKTVTVSNTGDQATGALTIAASGANAGSFTVSKTSIADIAVGGSDTFTVVPNTGLAAATYTATITVSGGSGISASFNVSFTVSPPPDYGISLSETGTYAFPNAVTGYAAPAAKSVTISNTGTHATGALTIAASGANAGSFTVSKTSVTDIAIAGSDTFTVVPNTGLAAGTYAATITVSGGNSITGSFNVSFTVSAPPNYGISLSETGTYTFFDAVTGYAAPTAITVTISNIGTHATGALTIGKSGANAASFTVSKTSITDIAVAGSDTFTVVPNTGLAVGSYTATITVSGGNSVTASFDVSFTVSEPPNYGVSLGERAYTFPSVVTGVAPEAKTVTVSNIGTHATGALTIAASGTNAGSFTVSKTSIADIAVGGTDTFTVVPNMGLAEGSYTATITVSGGNGITASFDVDFTLNPRYGIDVRLDGADTETYTFIESYFGMDVRQTLTVSVYNNGGHLPGELTIGISGTGAAGFTVSKTSIADVVTTETFTVAPKTGLAVGTHTATITVSGDHDISESFDVSFTVLAQDYAISLGELTYTFPAADFGYAVPTAKTVTITNIGTHATGALRISIPIADAANFTVSKTDITDIAVGGSETFTVVPVTGLAAGTYTASIMVFGDHNISPYFEVNFRVNATPETPVYSVGLSKTGTHTFPNAVFGYGNQTVEPITVSNTGNQATGALAIAKSGTNAGSFTVSKTSIPSIAVGGTDTFTVVPNTGLAAGTYTATITVSGGNSISESFSVSFRVNAPAPATANVTITIADEVIDLTRSTDNDLSWKAGNTLQLTAPEGYTDYTWFVDFDNSYYKLISDRVIEIDPYVITPYAVDNYGTHSVLLRYKKDGIPYGCEVLFRVVR